MKITKKLIDKELRATGYFPSSIEVFRGEGYVYFSGVDWGETMVCVQFFNCLNIDQWIQEAIDLQSRNIETHTYY